MGLDPLQFQNQYNPKPNLLLDLLQCHTRLSASPITAQNFVTFVTHYSSKSFTMLDSFKSKISYTKDLL